MLLAAASMSKARSRYQGLTGQLAWMSDVAVNEWKEIPGSSFNNLAVSMGAPNGSGTMPGDKIDAWCGLVAAGTKIYTPWNGGHDNYWGNEVDVVDIGVSIPAPVRLENSSATGDVTFSSAAYSDGRPPSCHSYTSLHYNATDQRIIRVGAPAISKSGAQRNECASFSTVTNQTEAAGTVPDVPGSINETAPASWRDVNDNLYIIVSYNIYKYTRASNTWNGTAVASTLDQPGFQCCAALDTLRNRVLITGGANAQDKPWLFTPPSTTQAVTFGGSEPTILHSIGAGIVYCADIDRYVARLHTAGGAAYTVHPTTFAVEPLVTTGGASIPASVLGSIYSRILPMPSLNGLVYLPRYSSNFWFLRTS